MKFAPTVTQPKKHPESIWDHKQKDFFHAASETEGSLLLCRFSLHVSAEDLTLCHLKEKIISRSSK